MTQTNISVSISADVTQLQAQMAIAKAEVNAFNAQVSSLAKQMTTMQQGATASGETLDATLNSASWMP